MSTFLDDLERELVAAHPRRRAARRRAARARALRAAPLVLIVLLAGVFVVSVGGERASEPAAPVTEPGQRGFTPDLPAEPVAVLNGTTKLGLSAAVSHMLGAKTPMRTSDVVGNAPDRVGRTRVEYAKGFETQARRIASRLGAPVRPMRELQGAADGAAVAVFAGAEVRRVRSAVLRPVGLGPIAGNAGVVDRGDEDVVSVDAICEPGQSYAVWVVVDGSYRFAGFSEVTGGDGRVRGSRRMRLEGTPRRVIVSREPGPEVGTRPAEPVLVGVVR